MSTSIQSPTMSDPPVSLLGRSPTSVGEKRRDTAILRDKLPSVMQKTGHAHLGSSHAQPHTESDALRDALYRRLQLKNLIIAAVAEFLGTFLFLFFALATATRAATGEPGTITSQLYSSLGFGFSLCISAWVFFRISGGVQNPAITLALTLTGAMSWTKCIILSLVQYVAGIAAAALVSGLLPGDVSARTTLGPTTSVVQGFFLEFFLTCQLIFTVLMLAAEKHKGTFLAPVGIGLALFITQLLGQSYTGAGVNPARSLGPDVATATFEGYSWIYYIAPYFAAIVTAGFYWTLKWIRYETTSPDQDADEQRAGQYRQVILDGYGNVVGTVETVERSDYRFANETAAEEVDGEITNVAADSLQHHTSNTSNTNLIYTSGADYTSPQPSIPQTILTTQSQQYR